MGTVAAGPATPWNPWAELARRADIEFRLDPIAALLGGGLYARSGDRRAIVLDPALPRRRRRTALAHELIHDERGSGCDHPDAPDSWSAVVAREEATVDAEVARRLVPPDELRALGRARAASGDTLVPWEIADEFDVDEATAALALRLALAGTPRGGDPSLSPADGSSP